MVNIHESNMNTKLLSEDSMLKRARILKSLHNVTREMPLCILTGTFTSKILLNNSFRIIFFNFNFHLKRQKKGTYGIYNTIKSSRKCQSRLWALFLWVLGFLLGSCFTTQVVYQLSFLSRPAIDGWMIRGWRVHCRLKMSVQILEEVNKGGLCLMSLERDKSKKEMWD